MCDHVVDRWLGVVGFNELEDFDLVELVTAYGAAFVGVRPGAFTPVARGVGERFDR